MNRRYYLRLWVPILVVALVIILSFAFLSHYQNTQVRLGNKLNIQAVQLMRDVERVLAGMMQGVATGRDEPFVDAARTSNKLKGHIHELCASGVVAQADICPIYHELYRNLVTAVALFRENRTQEAALAMETVRHQGVALRMSLERIGERVAVNQDRLARTMNLFMIAAALLLLGVAVMNGLVFFPTLVVRPMQRMMAQTEAANAEKDMLFTIIAHDLRSPMSGLVTSTELLANQPELFSEKDIRTLTMELHKNAKNTFELLEDLLQWARMSQGGMDYAPTPCTLKEMVNMGLSTAQDLARSKAISIRSDIPHDVTVLVDQPMIKTVIRNILFNALKFTPRGGEIFITARQGGRTVTVAIQDNGMGMNGQVQSLIFSQEKGKRQLGTDGEKGTGLGLVLCKQFIEQHGGKIWVESEPGKGTTVFFTLPVSD